MPPMRAGKPSPENPLTQLGLAVCTATYSRTDSVWTLSLPGSNSWKAGIHFLGEENFCDMEKPHIFSIVSMCVHTSLILLFSQCPTKVTEFPGQMHPEQSNCSEHSGKEMVCGWEERLFTVTWFVISLEKTFLAFGSSLATYRQQHMLPAVFHSVFSTGTLPYTFNHLIPLWWIFFCLFNWVFVGLICSFCFVSCSS